MTYDALFAALADNNRRVLIDRLRRGPASVSVLARDLPISRPAVSQHLRVLSDAGLLNCEPRGNRRLYSLSNTGMATLKDYIDTLWDDALNAFAAHAQTLAAEAAMTQDPIHKTLTVPLTPEAAFELFTAKLADWWPMASHSLSAYEDALPLAVIVEPRLGGQILETKTDGSVHPWGKVTAWEPPARLGLLWHVGRPETEATRIDIRFAPHAEGTTVTLVHDGWAALGESANAIRGGYYTGWDQVLGQCFLKACVEAVSSD